MKNRYPLHDKWGGIFFVRYLHFKTLLGSIFNGRLLGRICGL